MFEDALKAGIPIMGVRTDDPVNFVSTLEYFSKKKVVHLSSKTISTLLLWTDDPSKVTADLFRTLSANSQQLVLLNPKAPNDLVFDAGLLPVPKQFIVDYLDGIVATDRIEEVYALLKGLSLKTASNIVMLTQARTGGTLLHELRRTRSLIAGGVQGLTPMDTTIGTYVYNPAMAKWLTTNKPYFLSKNTPDKVRPRGLLLDGPPGVGKSMAAKAIATSWKLPLYRVDVASSLSRWVGESEARITQALTLVEKEEPCVLLIDEIEKIFGSSGSDDAGVTTRILSQLLWWLSEHRSQVLTIMTTNAKHKLPTELYRFGRIDAVFSLPELFSNQLLDFAELVFKDLTGRSVEKSEAKKLSDHLINGLVEKNSTFMSHAQVVYEVSQLIKTEGWIKI